jgi:hypothetical protein
MSDTEHHDEGETEELVPEDESASTETDELADRQKAFDDKTVEADDLANQADEAAAKAKTAAEEASALGAGLPVKPPSASEVFLARLAQLKNMAGAVKRTLMIDQLAHAVVELIDTIETKALHDQKAAEPPTDEG